MKLTALPSQNKPSNEAAVRLVLALIDEIDKNDHNDNNKSGDLFAEQQGQERRINRLTTKRITATCD